MAKWIRPFKGGVNVTQPFGPTSFTSEPSEFGYQHFHDGVDYALPSGTELLAMYGGTVAFAGWDTTGFGNCVIINHGGGVSSLLGHMESISVQPEQNVAQGQVVGRSGSTGNSTGPHVHARARYNTYWPIPLGILVLDW